MVRLSLSFLSVAALTVASAAPFFGQQLFDSDAHEANRCVPETLVKEYQAFELESFALKSLVSRQLSDNLLVGGLRGNKNLQQLQFCIVSTDRECNPTFPTDCIRENVEYRFRVNGPLKGYLHIDGHVIRIVEDFHAASGLNLYKEAGWGLRISHFNRDGIRSVFTTTQPGSPIILERPEMNNRNQWFDLLPPYQINEVESLGPNRCIPEVQVKEYQSFQLESFALHSMVSKYYDDNIIVGGVNGNKNFQQLEFCIVSTDGECNPSYPTNCIYENVEYRFKVNGPQKGYLHVENNEIRIVEHFHAASGLNLYKESGWGLRIQHVMNTGLRIVFATTSPGHPLTLEPPMQGNANQWFELRSDMDRQVESFGDNHCVPETSIREYHPFQLKSSNLNTQVSKELDGDMLVGGVNGNKNFQQLEMCIVSSDYGCSSTIQSACIYQNVEYKFRVNSPTKGYLRIVDNEVKIVKTFEEASSLNLYKEPGWGLRIAHMKNDGTRIVFAAKKQGEPITLEAPVTNAARQWFQIMEANEHWLW
ncbi:hypothetical protein CPB97_009325 [Podila verticillata]|nr:hypothetical protein CPB97_009325 [Podila verticillata]